MYLPLPSPAATPQADGITKMVCSVQTQCGCSTFLPIPLSSPPPYVPWDPRLSYREEKLQVPKWRVKSVGSWACKNQRLLTETLRLFHAKMIASIPRTSDLIYQVVSPTGNKTMLKSDGGTSWQRVLGWTMSDHLG